jgi:hypothetical protein
LIAARDKLLLVVDEAELMNFLKSISRRRWLQRTNKTNRKKPWLPDKKLEHERNLLEDKFRRISPLELAAQLLELEAVMTLAAEKVTFQPGDFQRIQYAQKFVDELANAWLSATGELPTYSKPSRRSRNLSKFAAMLNIINQEVLSEGKFLSNSLQYYGQRAVKNIGQVSRHPPR